MIPVRQEIETAIPLRRHKGRLNFQRVRDDR